MANDELVPEIHDILKLVNESKYHECPENCKELSPIKNSELYKSLRHHCVFKEGEKEKKHTCQFYSISANMFSLALADD